MPASPSICAAICTYQRYGLLERALQSVRQQTLPAERYSILVVDNSPDGARAQEERARYEGVGNLRYLHTETPGLSNARNIALRECGTDIVAYLDDDAVAAPDWLERLVEAFDAFGEKAGAAGGPVRPIWEVERPAWLHDDLLTALTVVDWGGGLRLAGAEEWIAGANMAFRTAALAAAGAFSTALGRTGAGAVLLSNEELEVLARVRKAGYEAVWAPGALVSHQVARERLQQSWLRKRLAWQAVSDFVSTSGAGRPDLDVLWQGLVDFFHSMPPRLRTPRGLFAQVDDPDVFLKQARANYNMTMLLLHGQHFAASAAGAGAAADEEER